MRYHALRIPPIPESCVGSEVKRVVHSPSSAKCPVPVRKMKPTTKNNLHPPPFLNSTPLLPDTGPVVYFVDVDVAPAVVVVVAVVTSVVGRVG